jgi:putative peptide zinc metalloprotease protein
VTSRLAAPFAPLFRPVVVAVVVLAFAVTTWWVAFEKGLASAAHQALYEPGLLLVVFALTLLSAGFHEVGHAAACRYGGARPGGMGVGLYLVWPAFYTDVTESYRLGRGGRLRVDLGGLYFNAIFGVAILALWAAVRWDALLLVIAAQLLQMARQLVPVVRFDGYHVLADLTGVPDLFMHIKPTLLGLLPTRWDRAEGKVLKPWARAVVTLWVLVVVPLLATILALLVLVLPRIVATAWDSLGQQWGAFEKHWSHGDMYGATVAVLAMLMICLPVAGIAYLLTRIVRGTTRSVWRATADRPRLRAGAALAGSLLVAAVAWAWWPGDQYRPIEAGNPGTVADIPVLSSAGGPAPEPAVSYSSATADPAPAAPVVTAPVQRSGQGRWALVLLPQTWAAAGPEDVPTRSRAGAAPESAWPFPFDPPREPEEGDNQALAVNTQDGSSVFDVAVALVWITDGGPVDQRNEAYALASCSGCQTVAVAFQVVLIVGYAEVVTPINAAVAVNYACDDCVTQALAVQLVATLSQPPSAETMSELERVWAQLEEASQTFEMIPLQQVYDELRSTQVEILEILAQDGGAAAAEASVAAAEETAPSAGSTTPVQATTTTPAETSTSPDETTSAPTTTSEEPTTTSTTPTTTTTTSEEPTTTTEGGSETGEGTTTEETPTETTPP